MRQDINNTADNLRVLPEGGYKNLEDRIADLQILLEKCALQFNADALWTAKDVANYLRRSENWLNQRSKSVDFPRPINISAKTKPTSSGKSGRNGAPERLWRSRDIKLWISGLASE